MTTPVNTMCVLRWLNTIFTMSRIFFSRLAMPYLVSSNFNFNLLCAAGALYVLFKLCFLVLERSLIVRCMGLSYEESVRISMKWPSFRRSLFPLTSRGRNNLDVIHFFDVFNQSSQRSSVCDDANSFSCGHFRHYCIQPERDSALK